MSAILQVARSITFALAGTTRSDVQLVLRAARELGDELFRLAGGALKSKDFKDKDSFLFWLGETLPELVLNVVQHDQLDIHGAERNELLYGPELNAEQAARLRARAEAALGRTSSVSLEIDELFVKIRIGLSRPFDGFPQRWHDMKHYDPGPEDLKVQSGRGLLYAATAFDTGEYDPATRTITMIKRLA